MADYTNISNAGQLPSVSLITDYITANLAGEEHDALCIDKPNANGISRVYLLYSENGSILYYHARINVYWENGYITKLTSSTNNGNIDTSNELYKCYDLDSYFTVYGASTSTGGGGSADYTPYTEFWFPVVSIVAILFIFSLIYKIIIKRLLP